MNESSPFEEIHASIDQDTYRDIIVWWEKRRLWFNISVGIAGMIGLFSIRAIHILDILMGVIMYGILANILYTAGWATELLLRVKSNDRYDFGRFRKLIYYIGIVGSVLLTLFLSLIMFAIAVFGPGWD